MLNWASLKPVSENERSFSVRHSPFILTCSSSSHPSLTSGFILRPSWLQAAWCRPTVTLMWPWTSTGWRPAWCLRALLSGTTSACVSLGKRNMLLWVTRFFFFLFYVEVILFSHHLFTFPILFFLNFINQGSFCLAAALCTAPSWNHALLSSPPHSAVSLWLLHLP